MILDAAEQFKASSIRMKIYESMPEDVQSLSRQYGNIVDGFFVNGCNAEEIKRELAKLKRL